MLADDKKNGALPHRPRPVVLLIIDTYTVCAVVKQNAAHLHSMQVP